MSLNIKQVLMFLASKSLLFTTKIPSKSTYCKNKKVTTLLLL